MARAVRFKQNPGNEAFAYTIFDENNKDPRPFVRLADSYAKKNKEQALICLHQALFYAKDASQKEYIHKKISSLKNKGITVPKTSFIILSYNTLDFTRQCLMSLKSTVPLDRCQIVVVDNASSDGSVEYLRTLDWITLVENHENRGFPGGCNDGIAAAEKDNDIYLLNSDTLMPYNAFFWLKMGLYENSGIGSTGSITNFAAGSQMVKRDWKSADEMFEFADKTNVPMQSPYEYSMFLIGFSLLMKRKVLDTTGYLDERFNPGNSEDVDICLRILRQGYLNVICKNSFVLHIGHMSFEKLQEQGTDFVNLIEKNNDRLNQKYGFDVMSALSVNVSAVKNLRGSINDRIRILDTDAGMGATAAVIKSYFVNAEYTGIERDEKKACFAVPFGRIITENPTTMEYSRYFSEEYFDYIIVGQSFDGCEPSVLTSGFAPYLKEGGRICLTNGVVLKKNVRSRNCVVFLLYKASSWDSYESVWKAFKNNSTLQTIVIPLPYYDRKTDGGPAVLHYEGSLLPENVPVTWYSDVDLIQLRPAAVFINYALEPDVILPAQYEPAVIRGCTENVIYIPDEVLSISYGRHIDEGVRRQKELVHAPGIKAADIVCLENHDQEMILKTEAASEDCRRFIVTGAPQYDIMLGNEKTVIPDEWEHIISGKKVLLLSIKTADALDAGEMMIQKLEGLLRLMQSVSGRIALIMRPDGSMEDILLKQQHGIAKKYRDIIDRYKSEGWGIYDDSTCKYMSLRRADAFYGDVSPEMMLFLSSGKTAVMQDYGIMVPGADNAAKISVPDVSFPHGAALEETDPTAIIMYLGLLSEGKLPGAERKISCAGERIYELVKSRIEEKYPANR